MPATYYKPSRSKYKYGCRTPPQENETTTWITAELGHNNVFSSFWMWVHLSEARQIEFVRRYFRENKKREHNQKGSLLECLINGVTIPKDRNRKKPMQQ